MTRLAKPPRKFTPTLDTLVEVGANLYRTHSRVAKMFKDIEAQLTCARELAPLYLLVRDHAAVVLPGADFWALNGTYDTSGEVWGILWEATDPEVVVERFLGPLHRELGVTWHLRMDPERGLVWRSSIVPDRVSDIVIELALRQAKGCELVEEQTVVPAQARTVYRVKCEDGEGVKP